MCHETHVKYRAKKMQRAKSHDNSLLVKLSLQSKKEHRKWVPFSPGQAKNELSDLVKLNSMESTEGVKEGMNVVQLIFLISQQNWGKRRCCAVEHGEDGWST